MELLVVMAVVLLSIAAIFGFVSNTPTRRWAFEYEGRSFEVLNYAFSEAVKVDGVVVKNTQLSGDRLTNAVHAIALPDGRQIDIYVDVNGLSVDCMAKVGDDVVYDSKRRIAGAAGPALATLPDAEGPPVSEVLDDPRWEAARVLLDELGANPEVAPSARTLRTALRGAFAALSQAQKSAAAHRALGADDADLDRIVAHREAAVQEALGLLRQLHLAATSRDVPAAPDLESTLGRLAAEREVDDAELRAAAMRAAAAKRDRN